MAGEEGFLAGEEKKERKTPGIGGPGGWTNNGARGRVAGRLEGLKEGERVSFGFSLILTQGGGKRDKVLGYQGEDLCLFLCLSQGLVD